MRILIGSPLQQDPDIFREHRKSLEALRIPKGCSVDFFWVVNDCPEILPQLHDDEYEVVNFNQRVENHVWIPEATEKMAILRSILTDKALNDGYDYYLSIDTDLIVQPDTLVQLLDTGKDLVSEVFWTVADNGMVWCNSWMNDQYGQDKSFHDWLTPGLYKVGMTGALFLISRRVLESGVSYRTIPNIKTSLLGEDRHFCVRAACAGFEMWMDTNLPATHLYRRAEYERYMEVTYGNHDNR